MRDHFDNKISTDLSTPGIRPVDSPTEVPLDKAQVNEEGNVECSLKSQVFEVIEEPSKPEPEVESTQNPTSLCFSTVKEDPKIRLSNESLAHKHLVVTLFIGSLFISIAYTVLCFGFSPVILFKIAAAYPAALILYSLWETTTYKGLLCGDRLLCWTFDILNKSFYSISILQLEQLYQGRSAAQLLAIVSSASQIFVYLVFVFVIKRFVSCPKVSPLV